MVVLKSAAGRALALSRAYGAAMSNRAVIVAFHRVSTRLPEDPITKTARDFELFCRFFRANFDVIPLTELVNRLVEHRPLSGTLAITFDDGYLDNYEVAAPILWDLRLPATFFITTSFIGTDIVPWWDRELPEQPGWMDWQQVRDLAERGFDIGAHTQTHIDLGTVIDDVAAAEISGSRRDIIEEVGCAPAHFAYPFGSPGNLHESNRQRIMAAGFRSCLSCHGGLIRAGESPFTAHRVPISDWYRTPEHFGFEVVLGRA